jgi:hypothetical protein
MFTHDWRTGEKTFLFKCEDRLMEMQQRPHIYRALKIHIMIEFPYSLPNQAPINA